MKKFKFEFDTLLNVKKRKEDLIVQELAEAQTKLVAITNAISLASARISETLNFIRASYGRNIDMSYINIGNEYIKAMKYEKSRLEVDAAKAEDEILEIKKRLAEAMKERKVIETLKERKFEEYRMQYNKNDNFIMDEIANGKVAGRKE